VICGKEGHSQLLPLSRSLRNIAKFGSFFRSAASVCILLGGRNFGTLANGVARRLVVARIRSIS
jgi:hypothetical protein